MQVGKLVIWSSNFWGLDQYKNPGIVLEGCKTSGKYCIMWSDGKISVEHEGYLQEVKNESRGFGDTQKVSDRLEKPTGNGTKE